VFNDRLPINDRNDLSGSESTDRLVCPPYPSGDELFSARLFDEVGGIVIAIGRRLSVGPLSRLPSERVFDVQPIDERPEVSSSPALGHRLEIVLSVVPSSSPSPVFVLWHPNQDGSPVIAAKDERPSIVDAI